VQRLAVPLRTFVLALLRFTREDLFSKELIRASLHLTHHKMGILADISDRWAERRAKDELKTDIQEL